VSPLVVQVSPLTTGVENAIASNRASESLAFGRANPFGAAWRLWGALGLIPVAALFAWALRPYQEDES
jgi:hypothetical protein